MTGQREKKNKQQKQNGSKDEPQDVEIEFDEKMSFGMSFDPSEWA